MKDRKNSSSYKLKKIQNIPLEIDLTDLNYQNKLLTEDEIKAIKEANLPEGRTTRAHLKTLPGLQDINYAIKRVGDQYYAIYYGRSHGKEIYYSEGNQRLVKYAQNIDSGEWAVIKIEKYAEDTLSEKLEDANYAHDKEIKGLKAAGQFITAEQRLNKDGTKFQNEYLIKYIHGKNLIRLIEQSKFMPAHMWLDIAINTLNEIKELHESGMIHRDIKPENFMHGNGDTTAIDFGLSEQVSPDNELVFYDKDKLGTKGYIAPEIVTHVNDDENYKHSYNEKSEVYALGHTNAELLGMTTDLNNHRFIPAYSREDQNQQIGENIFRNNLKLSPRARAETHRLLDKMTDASPSIRPSISEAILQLMDIRDNILNAESHCLISGYLNINDYLNADAYTRTQLIESLQSVHEVWLIVDKNEENIKRGPDIKRDLELTGLRVYDTILQCDKNDVLTTIAEFTEDRKEKNNALYYSNVYATTDQNLPKGELAKNAIVLIHPDEGLDESERNYATEITTAINNLPVTKEDYKKLKSDAENIFNSTRNPDALPGLTSLHQKIYDAVTLEIKHFPDPEKALRMDVISLLGLYEANTYKLEKIDATRIRLLEEVNNISSADLSEENANSKAELEHTLERLFAARPIKIDLVRFDEYINRYQQQIELAESRLDTIFQNIEKENAESSLHAIRTAEEENEARRNDLKTQVIMCHHELKELLEKVILLENYLEKYQFSLTPEEYNSISIEINRGYQTIIYCSPSLDDTKPIIEQPLIKQDEYLEAYGKIQWPDLQKIQDLTESIRQHDNNAYRELLTSSRDALIVLEQPHESLSLQNKTRLEAFDILHRTAKDYINPEDDWRKDLFLHRMNRIIFSENDEYFPGTELSRSFREYYDINSAQLKPEYQQYGDLSANRRKVKVASNVLVKRDFLLTRIGAARELDDIIQHPAENREKFDNWRKEDTSLGWVIGLTPEDKKKLEKKITEAAIAINESDFVLESKKVLPDAREKHYQFATYPAELKKLSDLAIELNNLRLNKNQPGLSANTPQALENRKNTVKQLDTLERRIRNQMQFVSTHWPTYRLNPNFPSDHRLLFSTSIARAEEALNASNDFIRYYNRLGFIKDIFNDSKNHLGELIQSVDITNKDGLHIRLINIIDEIDNINDQYKRMQQDKKRIKKIDKHIHIGRLIKSEKQYISELAETRKKFLGLLNNHDANLNLHAAAQQLGASLLSVSSCIQFLPLTDKEKEDFNAILESTKQNLAQTMETNALTSDELMEKSRYIASIKNHLNLTLISKLTKIPEIDKSILERIASHPVERSKGHEERNTLLNTLIPDLSDFSGRLDNINFSTTSLVNQLSHLAQISRDTQDLEKQYTTYVNAYSFENVTAKLLELEYMLENCSDDDKPALMDIKKTHDDLLLSLAFSDFSFDKVIAQHQEAESAIKIADEELNRIRALDKEYEITLLNQATALHNIISASANIPDMHQDTKIRLADFADQLAELKAPYTNLPANEFITYSELATFKQDVEQLNQEFRNFILVNHIGNLSDEDASLIKDISNYKLPKQDLGKNISLKLHTAIDNLIYHSATHSSTIPDDELPHFAQLAILNHSQVVELNKSIQPELLSLEGKLSNSINKIQDNLDKYKEIIHEYDAMPDEKEAHLTILEKLNDELKTIQSTHNNTRPSYDYLNDTKSALDEIEAKCAIQASLLAMVSVTKKELKQLETLSNRYQYNDNYQKYLAGKISSLKNMQNIISKVDQITSSSEKKEVTDSLSNQLMSIIESNILNTLDEHLSDDNIKSGKFNNHFNDFYGLSFESFKIDYGTLLHNTNISHDRILYKTELLLIRKNISDSIDRIQDTLNKYKNIALEYDGTLDEKKAHLLILQQMNDDLHKTNSQPALNELETKCEIQFNLLVMTNVTQKELRELNILSDEYKNNDGHQKSLSEKISRLEDIQNAISKFDQTIPLSEQKKMADHLSRQLRASSSSESLNKLDEYAKIRNLNQQAKAVNKIDLNLNESEAFDPTRHAVVTVTQSTDINQSVVDSSQLADTIQPVFEPLEQSSDKIAKQLLTEFEKNSNRIKELNLEIDKLRNELSQPEFRSMDQSNLQLATIAAEHQSLSDSITYITNQMPTTINASTSATLDFIENTIKEHSDNIARLHKRIKLHNEITPPSKAPKIESSNFEQGDKFPTENILKAEDTIQTLTQAARKYLFDDVLPYHFASILLSSNNTLSNYPKLYEKLAEIAEALNTDTPKQNVFNRYQEFNLLLPEDLRQDEQALNDLQSRMNAVPDEPLLENEEISPSEKNSRASILPQKKPIPHSEKQRRIPVSRHPDPPPSVEEQPEKALEKIMDNAWNKNLATSLRELNHFMNQYSQEGLRRGRGVDDKIIELQKHIGKIYTLLDESHPLHATLTPLYKDLFNANGTPKVTSNIHLIKPSELDAHYTAAKKSVRNLENYTNEFIGPKQKGITFLTRTTNDLVIQAERNMQSTAPAALKNLDDILKRSRELREEISVIIGKKDASPPSHIDALNESVNQLTDTINKITNHEKPTKVMTHATSEVIYIDLNEGTLQENFLKITDALNSSLTAPGKTSSAAVPNARTTDDRLDGKAFRIDPVETYNYEKHGGPGSLFSKSTSGVVKTATALGTLEDNYKGFFVYSGDLDKLSDEDRLVIAAIFVNKLYSKLPEGKKMRLVMDEDIPPEIARAAKAYCKYSTDNYPEPDISDVPMKEFSPEKQKKFDKKLKNMLRDPQVVKRITDSADVTLSAELKAKQRKQKLQKLQKLSGQTTPFKPKI